MNNHTSIIRIDKDEVFKEISKLTSYMGDKDNQPEAYSKILATDELPSTNKSAPFINKINPIINHT